MLKKGLSTEEIKLEQIPLELVGHGAKAV